MAFVRMGGLLNFNMHLYIYSNEQAKYFKLHGGSVLGIGDNRPILRFVIICMMYGAFKRHARDASNFTGILVILPAVYISHHTKSTSVDA